MKNLNWTKATIGELYTVSMDKQCSFFDRLAARNELQRRNMVFRANIRYREKRRYKG